MELDHENGEDIDETVKAFEVLNEVKDSAANVAVTVKSIISQYEEGKMSTEKGLSLLDLKCNSLLNYLINLSYLALKKCSGEKIESDEAIMRLVELRTVMEKIRPIEAKLKYHIDKLLKFIPGNINENDPLNFRANPDNLLLPENDEDGNGSGDDDDDDDDEQMNTKSNTYQPPKLVPMHFEEDGANKQTKLAERARNRAISSSIIRELKEEHYDGPEEIKNDSFSHRRTLNNETKRRVEYEEDHFVRLSVSAKEKHEAKRRNISGLNDLTHFGDIRALSDKEPMEFGNKKKKQSKLKGKKKYRGKGSKKRK